MTKINLFWTRCRRHNFLFLIALLLALNYLFVDLDYPGINLGNGLKKVSNRSPQTHFLDNERGSSPVLKSSQLSSFSVEMTPISNQGPPIYILWSRWRRGSSFLGKLLAYAKTNTFYSYEPLHALGLTVFGQKESTTHYALRLLLELMDCKYHLHQYLLNYFVETEFYFFYNPLTRRRCRPIVSCNHTSILEDLCTGAGLQVIKLLRLSLEFGKYFLVKNPRVKIIYLIRDPRGTLKSRSRLLWCLMTKDCHNPASVCQILQKEIEFSFHLRQQYPDRFFFVRYEDLTRNPKSVFRELWSDLGQNFTGRINRMINKHTTSDIEKGTYGLKKDSKKKVFSWRSSLDYKTMIKIQNSCQTPMEALGYHIFTNEEDYENQNTSALAAEWRSPLARYSKQDVQSKTT